MAPLARMVERKCRVAFGIDGSALDQDEDALRELRLAQLLHAGTGFTVAVSPGQLLRMAFANGRLSVSNVDDGGIIAAGGPADLLMLDWAALDDDRLCDNLDPLDLMLTRATARHISELMVGGRTVVKDGVVTGVDLPGARAEVLAQMRGGMARNGALASAMAALDRALALHFEPDHPCC